jgi:hypothetical protein
MTAIAGEGLRLSVATNELESVDAQLHDMMGWAAHLEVEANKLRASFMDEKKRIQADYQQRTSVALAKGSASGFSRITLMVVQRGNNLGLQWHTVGVGHKSKKPYYSYVRSSEGGNYSPRTLGKLARDWERDLVLATEADCAVIRDSWRVLQKLRRSLLHIRGEAAKVLAASKSGEAEQ